MAPGPMPPVVSKPAGRNDHPAALHGPASAAIFACSASVAETLGSHRAAGVADWRSGWETVTSHARREESVQLKSRSAGRARELGIHTSSCGFHPAWWARRYSVSRSRLWRRYIPLAGHERAWSPNESIGRRQARQVEFSGERGRPVRNCKSSCHSCGENWGASGL